MRWLAARSRPAGGIKNDLNVRAIFLEAQKLLRRVSPKGLRIGEQIYAWLEAGLLKEPRDYKTIAAIVPFAA